MSRYFAFFALFALAVAYPASDDFPRPITTITESDFEEPSPWFRFPPFGNIFAPLTKLFSSFADIGPRIEVDDNQFRVIVNCKDYKKEDLKVKVKGDFILVQGSHEAKHDDHDLFASQFFHTYSLPLNASASDVTATLSSDGYLDVTAPINGAVDSNKVIEREVPIVESGKPLKEEKEQVPVPSVDKVENTDKTEKVEKVETPDALVEPVNNVESIDKIETLDTPLEPLTKVENVDKTESLDKPVESPAKIENIDKTESLEKPVESLAKVENVDKVESLDKPVESLDKPVESLDKPIESLAKSENVDKPVETLDTVENVDKAESLDTPVEPLAKVDNVEKAEAIDAPVEPLAKVENVDKAESIDTPVEPTAISEKVDKVETLDAPVESLAKVENVEKVEQPAQVATEATLKAEDDTKESPSEDSTPGPFPDDETETVNNEVNEIKP